MNEPHVYQHISPQARPLLDLLVQPLHIEEIAKRLTLANGPAVQYRIYGLLDSLGVERIAGHSLVWRVQLVRLYYGIDPCWCQR